MTHVATRTCVGCRRKEAASQFVRLVVVDGHVRPGPRAGRSGRGASIHPRQTCVFTAVERRAFARAFRQPVSALPGASELGSDGRGVDALAMKAFADEIEVAYISQQPRSR
ncbi:MAG: YlxR family protein [Pseudomonadota bacterium]